MAVGAGGQEGERLEYCTWQPSELDRWLPLLQSYDLECQLDGMKR